MTLNRKVEQFAQDLTRTVRAVVGKHCPRFEVKGDKGNYVVQQAEDKGIPLEIDGVPQFLITVEYACALDHKGLHLRVVDSKLAFFYSPAGVGREILFRYEFSRPKSRDVPAAHLHIHHEGTRLDSSGASAMSAALSLGGRATRRGARRQGQIERGGSPTHQDLHYPLGGERFRPCLEDFLEGLIHEFGIDKQEGWREVLADGREKWRLAQTAAVVRDSPETAVKALRELGYDISPPPGGPVRSRTDRVRAL